MYAHSVYNNLATSVKHTFSCYAVSCFAVGDWPKLQ